eukprot:TRINITY_DN58823_c0_g1_i1.p1 TRINITY_DN58823_c0_g1~~TRINITY_DN58823_c0_g1_i1.p1  ORF type:complete len:135 (+),score=0.37 TRINITY_DN58823_c0_g1_i1:138-542(+)
MCIRDRVSTQSTGVSSSPPLGLQRRPLTTFQLASLLHMTKRSSIGSAVLGLVVVLPLGGAAVKARDAVRWATLKSRSLRTCGTCPSTPRQGSVADDAHCLPDECLPLSLCVERLSVSWCVCVRAGNNGAYQCPQ